MKNFSLIYNDSKETFLQAIPDYWQEMYSLCDSFVDNRLLPEIITPAACCKAVGGEIMDVKEIGAAILAAEMSVRLLDDLTDQDKPNALHNKIGAARTLNYIDAFRTIAYKILINKCSKDPRYLKIVQAFTECYLVVLAGQDRDLKHYDINWDEAWKTIEMKTGYIYASTAAMGAMAGTDNETEIKACRKYGYHLGMAIQLFNDMDGIWSPEGSSDLEQGKITLPLIYALECQHDAREELLMIVQQNKIAHQATRVKEILDAAGAKDYLVWAALNQRESGLEALQLLPDNEGRKLLEAHFTGMFGDIGELITPTGKAEYNNQAAQKIAEESGSDILNTDEIVKDVSSQALNIRRKLRREFT